MKENITGYTSLLGIIGNPVRHSLSPAMYNFGFKELGLDYIYLAFELEIDNVGDYITAMKTLKMRGGNVTMPFKASVIPFLDEISTEASLLGAVNTLINDNGKIKGYNTDGNGMVLSITSEGYQVAGTSICIFGAGGAASAVMVACCLAGASDIYMFTRNGCSPTVEKIVKNLKIERPHCNITTNFFNNTDALKRCTGSAQILINTTPLGMSPNQKSTPLESRFFLPKHLVVDAVYNPRETRFLKEAKLAGCKTIDGTGMLLWQGVEAFKLFTGKVMPVDKLAQIIFGKN